MAFHKIVVKRKSKPGNGIENDRNGGRGAAFQTRRLVEKKKSSLKRWCVSRGTRGSISDEGANVRP